MDDEIPQHHEPLNFLESFAVSLGFWSTLVSATAMYAALVLAPKLLENVELRDSANRLNKIVSRRESEVVHLNRLASAIEHDADFLARIRSREFSLQRKGTIEIAVSAELGFDARVPQFRDEKKEAESTWYIGFLRQLSVSSDLRRNWNCVMLSLFLVSFLIMNEKFFAGQWGKAIFSFAGNLFQRYRVPPSNLDEEGCQRPA